MIKRLARIFGIVIVTLSLILFIADYYQTKSNTIEFIDYLETQVIDLSIQNNKLLTNDLELIQLVNKNYINLSELINRQNQESIKNITEINKYLDKTNIDKMIRSDVFVQGIMGQGAGTVIKKTETEMYILTCHHVVDDVIIMNDFGIKIGALVGYTKQDDKNKIGGTITYAAEIVKYSKDVDLALLKVSIIDNDLEVAAIALITPEKGDTVYSVGSPLGMLRTFSKGVLANKEDGFYITDCTTTYGNSGGGLYNSRGELIGVPSNVTGYKIGEEGFAPETSLGLARDLDTIKTFLKDII